MNVQFALEENDENASPKLTGLAVTQASQHNGADLNQVDFEVDPDLQGEIEIDLPRDIQASARTRTTMSGKSVKSRKSDASDARISIVRSRGRPIKPHETEPFLSIDNLPANKALVSEKTNMSMYTPRPSTNRSGGQTYDKSVVMAQNSNYMTPYSYETPGPPSPSMVSDQKSPLPGSGPLSVSRPSSGAQNYEIHFVPYIDGGKESKTAIRPNSGSRPSTGSARNKTGSKLRPSSRPGTGSRSQNREQGNEGRYRSQPSRNGRITPANTPFQSPSKQYHPPNHHIKTPFKHAVLKPAITPDGRMTPSQGMKERTTLAASHLNKILTVASEKDAHKTSGKLKKGKLKPLYPVNVEGPAIDKCRGIISETRQYGAAPSRTLQRRMHLMNTIPNVHEYLYDRPRTVESVHRTSVASSIDDNLNNIDYDDNLDSNRMLPDETLYIQKSGSIIEPVTPENTFIPVNTQENTIDNISLSERTPRMFATEVGHQETELAENGLVPSNQLQHELYVGESLELRKDTQTLETNKNNSTEVLESDDQTGDTLESEFVEKTDSDPARMTSSSKSVRFIERNNDNLLVEDPKELKQITNAEIAKKDKVQQETDSGHESNEKKDDLVTKKNQHNKTSCRSDDINDLYRKDEDDDDSNRDSGGKGGNFRGNSSLEKGNSGKEKGDNSNGNSDDKGGNHGKQATGARHSTCRQKSAASSRPISARKKKLSASSSAKNSSRSEHKTASKTGRCSKFENSKASESHTQSLQVSSVLHGDSVATTLRPQSPTRSPSRSLRAIRIPIWSRDQLNDLQDDPYLDHYINYAATDTLSDLTRTCDGAYSHSYPNHKSRVKFMIEGESPEMETIFLEGDDNSVELQPDKDITFEALDTELAALRLTIHNQLQDNISNNCQTDDLVSDTEETYDSASENEEETNAETTTQDTVREEYSALIERYRQRCMDRSESVGAISGSLITPREPDTLAGYQRPQSRNSGSGRDKYCDDKDDTTDFEMRRAGLSDSGHGSVSNLSDLSKSAVGTTSSSIPRLELGSCTSDAGFETARSDVTAGSDVTITGNKTRGSIEDNDNTRNLLELVCDSLVTPDQSVKKETRQALEEDVSSLKVVATSKSLSKTKQSKVVKSSSTTAPFPPLCFTINSRPPTGFLYYFAYGPDMNPDRFGNYIKRGIQERFWGLLFGFSLVFNKRGSSVETGGFANLEFNPLRSVEGCVYKITQEELQVLDKCLGYPEHYEHLVLPVWMSNSLEPDSHGVAQYCVPALTFIAQDKWTEPEMTFPCDYAISQCIKSADLLTPEYRESLVSMATQQIQISA